MRGEIYDAIEAGHYTLNSIKKAAGIAAYKDISGELDELISEHLIGKHQNGTLTIYTPAGKVPKKFWLNGEPGGVEIESEEGSNGNGAAAPAKRKYIRKATAKGSNGNKPKRKYTRRPAVEKPDVVRATKVKESPEPPPAGGPVHSRYVTLSSGGQIVVGFSGSIFDLQPKEAALLSQIGNALRDFQEVSA